MNLMRTRSLMTMILAIVPCSIAFGDEAQELFDSVFTANVKAALATRDTKDDLAVAEEMVSTAKTSANLPKLLTLLCDQAFALAQKDPGGQATALAAMQLVIEHVPAQRAAAHDKITDLRQRAFTRGKPAERAAAGEALIEALLAAADERAQAKDTAGEVGYLRRANPVAAAVKSPKADSIADRLDDLVRRQRVTEQVARLKEQLLADATDAAKAADLVTMLIVDLDNPATTTSYLVLLKDETLKKRAILAQKATGELTETEALELGDWYRALSDKAESTGKRNTLSRAIGCYRRYIEAHASTDIAGKKAELLLKEVEDKLARLGAAASIRPDATRPKANDWIDLLKAADAKDALQGKWTVQSGVVVGPSDWGARLALPVVAKGDYQLRVKFVRKSGSDSFNLILPLGDASAISVIADGWPRDGGMSVLSLIGKGNRGPGDVLIQKGIKFTNGKAHVMEATVKSKDGKASVAIELDGKPFLHWTGDPADVKSPPPWNVPEKGQIGIGSSSSVYEIGAIQLKMLSGEAKMLR